MEANGNRRQGGSSRFAIPPLALTLSSGRRWLRWKSSSILTRSPLPAHCLPTHPAHFPLHHIPVTILRRQVRAPPSSCRVRISGSAASRAPSLPLHTTTRLRRLDSLSAEPCTSRRPLDYAAAQGSALTRFLESLLSLPFHSLHHTRAYSRALTRSHSYATPHSHTPTDRNHGQGHQILRHPRLRARRYRVPAQDRIPQGRPQAPPRQERTLARIRGEVQGDLTRIRSPLRPPKAPNLRPVW